MNLFSQAQAYSDNRSDRLWFHPSLPKKAKLRQILHLVDPCIFPATNAVAHILAGKR
jgi:hypothetical protein